MAKLREVHQAMLEAQLERLEGIFSSITRIQHYYKSAFKFSNEGLGDFD